MARMPVPRYIGSGSQTPMIMPEFRPILGAVELGIADDGECAGHEQAAQITVPLLLKILPSLSRPPLECCLGTSPIQAEKLRPDRKALGSPTAIHIRASGASLACLAPDRNRRRQPGDERQPAQIQLGCLRTSIVLRKQRALSCRRARALARPFAAALAPFRLALRDAPGWATDVASGWRDSDCPPRCHHEDLFPIHGDFPKHAIGSMAIGLPIKKFNRSEFLTGTFVTCPRFASWRSR